MPRYEAFFFDFDGVLADTVEVKTRAFAHIFEPFGAAVRDKVIEHHRNNSGVPRADKFRYYFEHFLKKTEAAGLTSGEIQEAAEIADQIKNGARMTIRSSIREMIGLASASCQSESERPCCC